MNHQVTQNKKMIHKSHDKILFNKSLILRNSLTPEKILFTLESGFENLMIRRRSELKIS